MAGPVTRCHQHLHRHDAVRRPVLTDVGQCPPRPTLRRLSSPVLGDDAYLTPWRHLTKAISAARQAGAVLSGLFIPGGHMRAVLRAAFAIVSTVVLVGCAPSAPAPSDSALQNRLVADVTGKGAFTHLEALQRIADNNGGNRASPGPGYDASVDYVAGVLRKAGYQVSTPTFRVDGTTVRNVIAQTRTGDPERVVMAGAHLDSVEEGPGINDNGSGVAALLEIAVRLGDSPPVSNAVRFAWWGAEETGLRGSTNYVEELSQEDRDRIAFYLNLDMVGSPNAGYLVQGGEGRRSRSSGPDGSATVARVLVDQLAAAGVTAETIEFEDDSDYAPFIEADIPSAGVLTGDDGKKTAEQATRWGGQAGEVFDRCYHKACDRLSNIDSTALDRFTDAVAGTMAHFAVSTDGLAR
jgi:aminopeptidase S